ncbi:MAG: S1C family serine protease [Streptosporangiaceae bacterium]
MSQTYDPNQPERGQDYPGQHQQNPGQQQGYPSQQPGQGYQGQQHQGYLGGPAFAGGTGSTGSTGGTGSTGSTGSQQPWWTMAMPTPPPPRRNRRRGLVLTGAIALAAGAAAGGLISGLSGTSSAGTATATSKTMLTASQIAARVDPALVDIVSSDSLQQETSAGTGIVLTSTGEILTNNHVIDGATSIKVTDVGNGKTYTASVVGYDASHDVAVLQLKDASGLTIASLGNSSSVQVGDTVVALGNAEGKGGTPSVASGTVTALNQSITASDEGSGTSEQLTGLIETNADIQPGDSGGSLVNAYGQVVGMDTAASTSYQFQTQSGQSAEQAYSIPINEAVAIAKQIEAGTSSADVHIGATGFLGLEIGSSSQSPFGGLGGSGDTSSVTIAGTVSGSPAASAGLTAGDEITAVGGHSVSTGEDIAKALVPYHPGDSVSISWVDSSGQSHTATVTLATGPAA